MKRKPETTSQTAPQSDPQQPPARRFQCRHIRVNGMRCGAVCLRGESLCYYHHSSHRRRTIAASSEPQLETMLVSLIEDRASIQVALNDVMSRIAANSIDPRRAGLLLYALQIASCNFPRQAPLKPKSAREEDEDSIAVEDLELDPELGPLAPINEFVTDTEARKSLMQKFVEYCERPPNACRRCADRAIVDANKAEGRRLMAELNRRRSLGLPEYDPPLDPNTPYPNDALCAAETARIAAEWATPSSTTQPATGNLQPATPPPHAEAPNEPALPNPDPETWAKFAAHLPNLKASADNHTHTRSCATRIGGRYKSLRPR